jgi:hypothetical protein
MMGFALEKGLSTPTEGEILTVSQDDTKTPSAKLN